MSACAGPPWGGVGRNPARDAVGSPFPGALGGHGQQVAAFGPQADQRHSWSADRRGFLGIGTAGCHSGNLSARDIDQCGNCGTTDAVAGWMVASLGLCAPTDTT